MGCAKGAEAEEAAAPEAPPSMRFKSVAGLLLLMPLAMLSFWTLAESSEEQYGGIWGTVMVRGWTGGEAGKCHSTALEEDGVGGPRKGWEARPGLAWKAVTA